MTDITLEALKQRERELELDAVLIRGRVLEIRNMIEELQRRRGGRPRKSAGLKMIDEPAWDGEPPAIIPQRVAGGVHEPETDEQLCHNGEVA